eukprot:g24212.t1
MEMELAKFQFKKRTGIFQCNHWAVYSDGPPKAIVLGVHHDGTVEKTIPIPGPPAMKGMQTCLGCASPKPYIMNANVLMRAWDKAAKDGIAGHLNCNERRWLPLLPDAVSRKDTMMKGKMGKIKSAKMEAGARMAAAHRSRMEDFRELLDYQCMCERCAKAMNRCCACGIAFDGTPIEVSLPLNHGPGSGDEAFDDVAFPDEDTTSWSERMDAALEHAWIVKVDADSMMSPQRLVEQIKEHGKYESRLIAVVAGMQFKSFQ